MVPQVARETNEELRAIKAYPAAGGLDIKSILFVARRWSFFHLGNQLGLEGLYVPCDLTYLLWRGGQWTSSVMQQDKTLCWRLFVCYYCFIYGAMLLLNELPLHNMIWWWYLIVFLCQAIIEWTGCYSDWGTALDWDTFG